MRIVPTAFLINKSEGPFGPFFSVGAELAGRTSTSRFLVVRLLCHAPPAIVLKCSREWDQRAGQPSICYEVGGGVVFFPVGGRLAFWHSYYIILLLRDTPAILLRSYEVSAYAVPFLLHNRILMLLSCAFSSSSSLVYGDGWRSRSKDLPFDISGKQPHSTCAS